MGEASRRQFAVQLIGILFTFQQVVLVWFLES
jgi:hypothetical protein